MSNYFCMKKLFLLLVTVLAMSLYASAQTRTVSGTVLDADTDEPILGASVVPMVNRWLARL